MTSVFFERRYPPLGNGFVDVSTPTLENCENESFRAQAVFGATRCRRSSSFTGQLLASFREGYSQGCKNGQSSTGGSNKMTKSTMRKCDVEAFQNLQNTVITTSSVESSITGSDVQNDDSVLLKSSWGSTTEKFLANREGHYGSSLHDTDVQTPLPCRPFVSAAANVDKMEDHIFLPEAFQYLLNVDRGRDEVLDGMLSTHGWTGEYFTSPPDWEAYVKILARASNLFRINSKSYRLLAAGSEIQEGKVQTDRSASQLFGEPRIEQAVHSNQQCFADLQPRPQCHQHVDAAHACHSQDSPKRGAVTTLMIQHLPPETQLRDLLEELDRSGFEDLYDFCHLPCSFSKRVGLGFAFVNFVSESTAATFMSEWAGSVRFSKTVVHIRPAALQGYEENINNWRPQRLRRIRNPNFRPYIVEKISQPREHISAVDGLQDARSCAGTASTSPPIDLREAAPAESAVPLSILGLRTF